MNNNVAAERFRKSFTVPSGSSYAPERITFGVVNVGVREDSGIGGVTVLSEGGVSGALIELWLPRLQDPATPASTIEMTDGDFFGPVHSITATGAFTFPLAAWPGAQIRVKSGGTAGSLVIDACSIRGSTGAGGS